jgi:hypothetical protein
MSRAKSAKDAKIGFDKKLEGWGLGELGVLGARKFLAVVLSNIAEVSIQLNMFDTLPWRKFG